MNVNITIFATIASHICIIEFFSGLLQKSCDKIILEIIILTELDI